jgi:hypothetical protein
MRCPLDVSLHYRYSPCNVLFATPSDALVAEVAPVAIAALLPLDALSVPLTWRGQVVLAEPLPGMARRVALWVPAALTGEVAERSGTQAVISPPHLARHFAIAKLLISLSPATPRSIAESGARCRHICHDPSPPTTGARGHGRCVGEGAVQEDGCGRVEFGNQNFKSHF